MNKLLYDYKLTTGATKTAHETDFNSNFFNEKYKNMLIVDITEHNKINIF